MNLSRKSITTFLGLVLLSSGVIAGPGTNEAFEQAKESAMQRSSNLGAHERLPMASNRYNMNQRLRWSKAQSNMTVDTEIAVFETGKKTYRPTKR